MLGMGTPPHSVRERLLDVAARLFYAEGIRAVGVDRLIAETGVAKASLYAHFAGKDDLVAAYLTGVSDNWLARVRRASEQRGANGADRALAPFDVLAAMAGSPGYRGCPFINAAAEYPGPGPVADAVAAHRRRVRATFGALLGGEDPPTAVASDDTARSGTAPSDTTPSAGRESVGTAQTETAPADEELVGDLVVLLDGALTAANLDGDPAAVTRASAVAADVVRRRPATGPASRTASPAT